MKLSWHVGTPTLYRNWLLLTGNHKKYEGDFFFLIPLTGTHGATWKELMLKKLQVVSHTLQLWFSASGHNSKISNRLLWFCLLYKDLLKCAPFPTYFTFCFTLSWIWLIHLQQLKRFAGSPASFTSWLIQKNVAAVRQELHNVTSWFDLT